MEKTRTYRFVIALLLIVALTMVVPISTGSGKAYAATNWETEDNDSTSYADPIKTNTTYYGNISESYDDDYYWFTLNKAGTVTLQFKHAYINDPDELWNVYLLDSDKDTLISTSIKGTSSSTSLLTMGLPAGTYYVRVSSPYSDWWDSTTYNFNVKYTASSVWEKEFNDSSSTANPIKTNTTYYGNISDSYDDDYYWFTIDKAGTVTLQFNHAYINDPDELWNVYLLDSDKDTLISTSIKATSSSTSLLTMGLPAGTYYVRVSSPYSDWWDSTTYNFNVKYTASSVWEKEFNDSNSTADPIKTNTTYYGNISDSYDEDYFWLHLTKKTKLNINFKHDKINSSAYYWDVDVYDESGKTYAAFDVKGNQTSITKEMGYLPAGDYFVGVGSDDKHSTKTYRFNVYTPKPKQTISGAKTFEKVYGNKAFSLKAKAKGKLSYKSSNTKVASVSSTGKVTIKGTGKATITVTAAATGNYAKTTKSVTVKVAPKKVASLKAKAGKKKMTVSWKKDTRATGYQIVYAQNKKFTKGKKSVTVSKYKTVKKTIKKLKAKKKYYVKVRAYKKSGSTKIYGAYSAVKRVKIK